MSLTLTVKEHEMLAAVIQEMTDIPNVDFNKIAAKTGQKYARNARSAFKRVWEKLRQGSNPAGGAPSPDNGNGDGEDVKPKAKTTKTEDAKPKPKTAKVAPKKVVGKTTTPRKASAGGPKIGSKTKAAAKKESDHDDDSDDQDMKQEADTPTRFTSANGADEDEHELRDANFMGISVEEWRELSRRAPTPEVTYSDNEE